MQKTLLLLALALSPAAWAQSVTINGAGVSLEANKAPINTKINPQAVAQLPQGYHFAVPGKFTVAVSALNSPPLTVFAEDNKTLLGSEVDIARLQFAGQVERELEHRVEQRGGAGQRVQFLKVVKQIGDGF